MEKKVIVEYNEILGNKGINFINLQHIIQDNLLKNRKLLDTELIFEKNYQIIKKNFLEESKKFLSLFDWNTYGLVKNIKNLKVFLEKKDILKNEDFFLFYQKINLELQKKLLEIEKIINYENLENNFKSYFFVINSAEKDHFDNFFKMILQNNIDKKKEKGIWGTITNFYKAHQEKNKYYDFDLFIFIENYFYIKNFLLKSILKIFKDKKIQNVYFEKILDIKKIDLEISIVNLLKNFINDSNFFYYLKKKVESIYKNELYIFNKELTKEKFFFGNDNGKINQILEMFKNKKKIFFDKIKILLVSEFSDCVLDFFFIKKLNEKFSKKLDMYFYKIFDTFFNINDFHKKYNLLIEKKIEKNNFLILFHLERDIIIDIIHNLFISKLNYLKYHNFYEIEIFKKDEKNYFHKFEKFKLIDKKKLEIFNNFLNEDINLKKIDIEKLKEINLNISEEKFILLLIELFKLFFNIESENFNTLYSTQKSYFFIFTKSLKLKNQKFPENYFFYLILSKIIKNQKKKYESKEINNLLKEQFKKKIEFYNISKIPEFRSKELILSISGFLSDNDKNKKNTEWKSVSSHLPFLEHITLNWEANNMFGFAESISSTIFEKKNLSDKIFDLMTNKTFDDSYKNGKLTGNNLAEIFYKQNFFDNKIINIISFSLGTIVTFEFLLNLIQKKKNYKKFVIGNICLLGACIDQTNFLNNIHFLIGNKGIVKNKIKIGFSKSDNILSILFKYSQVNKNALGYTGIQFEDICNSLKKNDSFFKDKDYDFIFDYVKSKIEIYDFSDIDLGHTSYRQNLGYILKKIDFMTNYQWNYN